MKKRTLSAVLISFFILLASCGGSSTTYTVGGTVSGLSGTVVLQNNTADDLTPSANGTFTFATALADAATYAVTVKTNPSGQTCTVTNGTGTISSANVTDVSVACVYDNKIIFITSSTFNGAIGSIANADAACMADANKPDAGTYKAMIVDGSARRACLNTGCAGGTGEGIDWVLAAGTAYYRSDATTLIGLTTSNGVFNLTLPLTNPFSAATYNIWTGMAGNWTGADSCTQWTASDAGHNGTNGATDQTDSNAISTAASGCNSTKYLACVAQ